MTHVENEAQPPAGLPAYGRFSRRLQGLLVDGIIVAIVVVGAVWLAVVLESESLARPLGFAIAAAWLLYEPLLVSLTGGTLGHYYCNLRVVDDRTSGNVSFLKAVARAVIKAGLGWISFISMGLTARHQAMHDLFTRSTVQIRDRALASPHHYIAARLEDARLSLPSRTRRLLVIAVYLLLCFGLLIAAMFALALVGRVSEACVWIDRCSMREERWVNAVSAVWLGASVLCIILGWRGRLYGARQRKLLKLS